MDSLNFFNANLIQKHLTILVKNKPFLYSHVPWTPAIVGPDCTSPSPAAPPAGIPGSIDGDAPYESHQASDPDLLERSVPGGAGRNQRQHYYM